MSSTIPESVEYIDGKFRIKGQIYCPKCDSYQVKTIEKNMLYECEVCAFHFTQSSSIVPQEQPKTS